ncbi:MAG: hypothetical protein LUH05_05155 [Candidatus Gastranaerophilales bacterium]|nr:hypothetical protein [Candidatus Gastranaerophilales bacterium]
MKVILRLFLTFVLIANFSLFSYGKEDSSSSVWSDDTAIFNKGFENQEPVSDSKLKETINAIKERNLTNKQKKMKKDMQPLSPMMDEEHLKEFTKSQSPDDDLSQTLTVMIPMQAYNEDGIWIQPGYYKLSCRRVAPDTYVLDLSQGTKRILSVNAKQTQQDLEQESISFCNAEIIDNDRIRLMYGSIDLNLVGYIYFKSLQKN